MGKLAGAVAHSESGIILYRLGGGDNHVELVDRVVERMLRQAMDNRLIVTPEGRTAVTDQAKSLTIGFLEPHLLRYGGIRRMVELANGLVSRGHHVTFYLPPHERMACAWMDCRAAVRPIPEGFGAPLDVLIFNEEPQWHLLELFRAASRTVFYALHYGMMYSKPGSWEAIRAPVHLQLSNSVWTAEQIAAETGNRPTVLLGGINSRHFRPVDVPKRYPALTVGDDRPWKGTEVVREAVAILGLPFNSYAEKALPQCKMAAEYCSAEVFVVGSDFEGFGQPGLEALACGVPLVTTDNGGSREYALDGETALVVPPRDPAAMAAAIDTLRRDRTLADRLRSAGLDLVAERFSWEHSVGRLEEILLDLVKSNPPKLPQAANRRKISVKPTLSVVVLAWDQLRYTQACVQSLRVNTDVPYEIVLVDNGSERETAAYAAQAADIAILNETNEGFARGMNQGLSACSGEFVAFVNNDTELPPGWASCLLDALVKSPRGGIVVPAVTAAGNDRTVRTTPGMGVEVIPPFEGPPSAVVYVMRTAIAKALGGWGEEYPVASAEDIDLCFKVWVNDLDVLFDTRTLVRHVGKGTAGEKLEDWQALWANNRTIFFHKWTAETIDVPRISSCDEKVFQRNLQVARSVVGWMQRYFSVRRNSRKSAFLRKTLQWFRPIVARTVRAFYRHRDNPKIRALDRWVKRHSTVDRWLRQVRR